MISKEMLLGIMGIVLAIIATPITYFWDDLFSNPTSEKVRFIETFSNRNNGWSIEKNNEEERFFDDGKYYIYNLRKGFNKTASFIKYDFTKFHDDTKYIIELSLKWIGGNTKNKKSFGLLFDDNKENQIFFAINNLGGAGVYIRYNGEWQGKHTILNEMGKFEPVTTKEEHRLKIEIKDYNFTLYVDDIPAGGGNLKEHWNKFNRIGLHVDSDTKILFDQLEIRKVDI